MPYTLDVAQVQWLNRRGLEAQFVDHAPDDAPHGFARGQLVSRCVLRKRGAQMTRECMIGEGPNEPAAWADAVTKLESRERAAGLCTREGLIPAAPPESSEPIPT